MKRPVKSLTPGQFMVEQKVLGETAYFSFHLKISDRIMQIVTESPPSYNALMMLLVDFGYVQLPDEYTE